MGKIERLKKSRKTLLWYEQHFGFRPPLRVVLSADFIKVCVSKNKRIDVLIRALLGDSVILETTRCTIQSLPYPASPSSDATSSSASSTEYELQKRYAQVARSFSLTFQCRHQHLGPEGVPKYSSIDCISKITETPVAKVLVATTDYGLFKALKKRAFVPLITANEQAQLALASPDKKKILQSDVLAVRKFNDMSKETQIIKDAKLETRVENKKQFQKFIQSERSNFPIQHPRKRSTARAPNPLSLKKKQRTPLPEQSQTVTSQINPLLSIDPSTIVPSTQKSKRKRIRKGSLKRERILKLSQKVED